MITLGGDGTIEVITGAASIGQGVETVMAQFCADGLGSRRGSGCGRHIA
jgi:carbon-monoxide dehydrogenase large subunit